jgi:hypothetical protein
MTRSNAVGWGLAATLALGTAALRADTLVMRDGRRIQGTLIGIRSGQIDFEEERTFGGRRSTRIDRDEVRRIEFDDQGRSSYDSPSGSRPSGLRERDVTVSADTHWNDAGVDVRTGQTVYFSATGRVKWGPDRRDGAAGESNSPRNPARPMPSRPAAGLIGKVGNSSSEYFFIGDEKGPVRMRAAGRLYLGINDDFLGDNQGNFRVTVYY